MTTPIKKTFNIVYTIEEASSWRSKDALRIKSNIADDKTIDCEIAESLVAELKSGAAILEPDKFLLSIAEAQKREIETSIEALNEMELQAKIHSDKAHDALMNIAEDAETKYEELEEKFSSTEKRFKKSIEDTTEKIKQSLEKLTEVETTLQSLNNYSLERLTETLKQLVTLVEKDPELVKLVLAHNNK